MAFLTKDNMDDFFAAYAKPGVSDIHLMSNQIPRVRDQGKVITVSGFEPIQKGDMEKIVEALLSNKGRVELSEHGSTDSSYQNQKHRFRLNVSMVYDPVLGSHTGLQLSARILSESIPLLFELGIPESTCKDILTLDRGLVLVTGVTGSGKSTTLASIINQIHQGEYVSIITLEQPIEYVFPQGKGYVRQREIPYSSESFVNGVREALRQDPDVILVGEVRDKATANAALQAADSGHLVFSTLHTGSAVETVSRLANWYPQEERSKLRSDLAGNLKYVLTQQLLPKKDGKGRVLALEIFRSSPAASHLIIEEKEQQQLRSYMQSQQKAGCLLMDDHILSLYQKGVITGDTALLYAHHKEAIRNSLFRSE